MVAGLPRFVYHGNGLTASVMPYTNLVRMSSCISHVLR